MLEKKEGAEAAFRRYHGAGRSELLNEHVSGVAQDESLSEEPPSLIFAADSLVEGSFYNGPRHVQDKKWG